MTLNEVSPPGWGHTKAEKEKTKPNKPKSKIGGSAAAFKRALDDGRFKGLPGSKTKKEKTADMFKLMWSMKKKGDKPHYKPGTDEKYKKYQEEGASIIQGGTSSKKVSYRGATSEKSQPKKSASFRGEKDESIPSKHKSARYASQLHRLRPRSERVKEETTMKDNNLFGNAYAGNKEWKKKNKKAMAHRYKTLHKGDAGGDVNEKTEYEKLKKKIGSKKKHDKPAMCEGISYKDFMSNVQKGIN